MSNADSSVQEPAFQLKGSMLAITVMELADNDLTRLDQQLTEKVAQAPAFFQNTPLILALDKLPEDRQVAELKPLMDLCRRHGLRTLAIRSQRETDIAAADALDLPVLPPSGARERPVDPAPAKAEEPSQKYRPSRIIDTPVRSGQQVYAAGCDLIVMAAVSAGAEILADGNIHVYAPMRGRALAGVKGDSNARIFCRQLGAELLSIAGRYKVAEDLRREPAWGEAVQVQLTDDMLNITRI